MRLCLNMIVRNEADKIERCLRSVAPYISSWVINDTGSTDGTPAKIEAFFKGLAIPGRIIEGSFENFSQARNVALAGARQCSGMFTPDYFLLCDADMELVVDNPEAFNTLTADCYLMTQRAGGIAYHNARLLKANTSYKYVGATHEYLDAPHGHNIVEGAYFVDHADGSNRVDKYRRDVKLLVDDLQTDPNNGRSWFYLGQSYREMGQWHNALCAYKRRIEIGGWDEELWNAQFNVAHCYNNMGNEAEFIRNLLLAYNMRPSRAETLYDLAHHLRLKGWNAPATAFAEIGLKIPHSKDSLFVNEFVYRVGLKEELAIAGYYDDRTRQQAFEACDDLALGTEYPHQRNTARHNLYHYLPSLSRVVRSFRPERIDFTPPDGYTPMNPSVAMAGSELCCIIRTVNYTITDGGQYAIKGGDGSVNNSNPIHTRNYLAKFSTNAWGMSDTQRPHTVREIVYNQNFPVKYGLVRGFEDMRLITKGHNLMASSCVREMESDGICQQVIATIGTDHTLRHIQPINRLPREYEKNWMPVIDPSWNAPLRFVYRLNHIVDEYGRDVAKFPNRLDVGHISGGSQVIPFFGGWLALVHEAMYHDSQRYYQHRFAYFNADLSLRGLSLPFVFFDRQIEFAAGLAQLGEFDLIMSFGVRDREAWLARIDATDVLEMEECRK